MKIGILSAGNGWHVQDLIRAAKQRRCDVILQDYRTLVGTIGSGPSTQSFDGCHAILTRTMPAGSLEQMIFRMDLLHYWQSQGQQLVNPPRCLEICVDKFWTSAILSQAGLPTPRTIVCQSRDQAMLAFEQLGRDVVVKPLFGSEGRGLVRVTDVELAWRTFQAMQVMQSVFYLQAYIDHPGWDYRVFILGGQVVASMKRIANNDWRTNIACGGSAESVTLPESDIALALSAAQATQCEIAGVDLIRDQQGKTWILEVNAMPGWKGLAEASRVDVAAAIIDYVTRGGPS